LIRKRTAALAAAALAASALAAAPVVAATGASQWSATHTQALDLAATTLGAAPASELLHVGVALPLRDKAVMDRLAVAVNTPGSPEYQHFLSPAEVTADFGPASTTVAAVESYLTSEGFTSVSAEPNNLIVDGYGTVAQVQRAFDTKIGLFRLGGKDVYANTSPAMVPSALAGDVAAVLGLSDVPMQLPHVAHSAAPGSPDVSGFSPQAIQNAYDATSLPPANGSTVAVIASGDMTPTINALRAAEAAWKLPAVPVNVVYAEDPAAITKDNPLTGNLEWDLDTQISTGVAQNVKQIDIYDVATFTDSEVARGINMFAGDSGPQSPQDLSASLGECDVLAFLDGAMITTDQSLEAASVEGRSMFASAGDNGFGCPEVASTGAPGGPPDVSWPADGEWTTGVGGTTLLADSSGNVIQEIAWIGGGGGVSPFEAAGPWTLQANPLGQMWEYTNQGGRGVPDVAADADPNTGVVVYTGPGSSTVVGGTSVSSPLTMGLWARADNADGGRLPTAAIAFYDLYNAVNPGSDATAPAGDPLGPTYVPDPNPGPVNGFRDIILGTNGADTARPGYDYTTGIGTVQAAALAKALAG
jgi:pseudomonalisin